MKNLLALLAILFCCTGFALDENLRQGMNAAVNNASLSIRNANLGGNSIAILPIRGDMQDIVLGGLKNALTDAGCAVVEGIEDPMLEELIKQIDWEHRKEDLLDASTISRFGSLNSAKTLVYGTVRDVDQTGDRVYVELELHATEVATARHIWGGSFVGRFYTGKDMQGIVSLDPSLKELLMKNFQEAGKSLKEAEGTGKFSQIKYTAVIPLAGDIDRYLTGLATEVLTGTNLHPRASDITTVSQVRATIRDGKLEEDAFLYGALRDLSRTAAPAYDTSEETASTIHADVQLFLEDSKSGEILWSKTISMQELVKEKKELGTGGKIIREVKTNYGWLKWPVIAIAVIIALGIAIGIIRSATDVR